MLHLYTWGTPNGKKVSIALEELGLPYTVHPVNIGAGAQFEAAYLKVNPNSKIPALVDDETGVTVFESGAILLYLAEKYGQFLPAAGADRYAVLQWLMFQMGGVGPMFGQAGHFARAEEKIPYAIQRYTTEALRLVGVLENALTGKEFIAGAYSIADMALYPWLSAMYRLGFDTAAYPQVVAWLERIGNRPAVQRGMLVPAT